MGQRDSNLFQVKEEIAVLLVETVILTGSTLFVDVEENFSSEHAEF